MIRNVIRGIGISALLLSSVSLFAQYRRDAPPPDDQGNYEGNANSVNAGGNWTEYSGEDRMTAAKRVRFELPADNAPNSDDQAKVILYCTNGKLKLADFRPDHAFGTTQLARILGTAANARDRARGQCPQLSQLELDQWPFSGHGQRHRA